MKTILAPFNGTKEGEYAVSVGAGLAKVSGRALHVLVYSDDPELHASSPKLFDRAVAAGTIDGIVPHASTMPPSRFISDAIVAEAERRPDSILCISSHGLGRMAVVRGSLAVDILTYASGPVILVGSDCLIPSENTAGTIIVALDGTDDSERIVASAHEWAQETDSPIELVEVLAPEPSPALASAVGSGDIIESSYVAGMAEDEEFDGDDVTFEVLHGRPAQEILREAEARRASLIAMSSHVPLGFDRLVHGSVLGRVAKKAKVPILTINQHPASQHPANQHRA